MLADRRRQLVERLLVEGEARLLGVRLDAVDRDDADADAARRAVRREQADDGGRELALLGEAPRGRGAEIRSWPRSTTSRASSRYVRAASLAPAYDVIGPPDERRLAELHGVADDAVEDVVVADDPQLVEHVPREVRAPVVERRQQAEDPQVAVELQADRVDDLDEIVQALHRVVLRLDRDDHAVRRDQAVDRQQAEVRRAIDEDVVVAHRSALRAPRAGSARGRAR